MPIFLSAPVLLEGLGTKYAGSAAGVISTLQLLGAVLIPTYILTPIAGENYSLLIYACIHMYGNYVPLWAVTPSVRKQSKVMNHKINENLPMLQ